MTAPRRILLTGGARSGKSRLAEQLLADRRTTYVATAPSGVGDAEWQTRVARHRARRPDHWTTVETDDLAPIVATATARAPVLVDCLTLWVMARLDRHGAWTEPTAAEDHMRADIRDLTAAVRAARGGLVLVTNEVGSGIVPEGRGVRLFQDMLGSCNAAVAEECDDAFLVVAGRVLRLERGLP